MILTAIKLALGVLNNENFCLQTIFRFIFFCHWHYIGLYVCRCTYRGLIMNGYKAFYKGKELEIYANSSYEAQKLATAQFKAKKSYDVTVILCEISGFQIIHNPSILGV